MADCGSCGLCCTLLHVPDIGKPAGMRCSHVGLHGGCEVHHKKESDPKLLACAQFKCVWLASQGHENLNFRMPREIRPDLCHVLLGPQDREDENLLYVHVDPRYPTAWREGSIADYISRNILARGGKVEVCIGDRRVQLDSAEDMPLTDSVKDAGD